MDSSVVNSSLNRYANHGLTDGDITFLCGASQALSSITTADELYDYITRTLRAYCGAAVAGLARCSDGKLIGQILSVDATSDIISRAETLLGRSLRWAPIAVPGVFRKGPGLTSALWSEAVYAPSADTTKKAAMPVTNLGVLFGFGQVYGFPFRYDGELYATAGVILPDGEILSPHQHVAIELFLGQALLATRPFLQRRHANEPARGSEPYRAMFDQTDVAVLLVENETIIDCNAQVSAIFGAPASQMVGTSLYSWVPPDLLSRVQDRIERRVADALGGRPQVFEVTASQPDGCRRIIELGLFPVHLPAGKVVLQVIARDCTQHRAIEEALKSSDARYRELFETSGDGIAIFDEQFRLLDCNPALLGLFGVSHVDELKGLTSFDLTPPEYHAVDRTIFDRVRESGYDEYEKEYLTPSGGRLLVMVRTWCRRDADGRVTGGWALLRDITASRHMEEEVVHIEKFRLLGELAAAISHEIRNPLTTVRGFAQFLASRPSCTPEDREIFQLMLSEVDSATTIIRDFLDMARPVGPRRDLFSLSAVLRSLIRVLESRALIQRVQIKTAISPDLWIIGDIGQMRQVFIDLVQNAIQAMPDGGQMTISAELVDGEAVVRIADTGVGISPPISSGSVGHSSRPEREELA